MVERCNASGQDQDESCDNGIDRAAFGELRDRCDYVSEPWLTHADIYDEDGAVAVSDERSVTANEARQAGGLSSCGWLRRYRRRPGSRRGAL